MMIILLFSLTYTLVAIFFAYLAYRQEKYDIVHNLWNYHQNLPSAIKTVESGEYDELLLTAAIFPGLFWPITAIIFATKNLRQNISNSFKKIISKLNEIWPIKYV